MSRLGRPQIITTTTTTTTASRSTRSVAARLVAVVAVAGIVATALVVFAHLGRGRTFFFDDWTFLLGRRAWTLDTFLEPHNGHLSLVPVAVYRALLAVAGMDGYPAFYWLGIGSHILVSGLVGTYAARRVGALFGGCLGIVVLFLGSGWQNILWPFQIGLMGSLAFGIVVLLLLDRRSIRSDVAASVAVALALGSSGVGIPIALGVAVRLAWSRNEWRRLWLVAVPLVLYLTWYLAYGVPQGGLDNLRQLTTYGRDAAAGALAGLAGRPLGWGYAFGLILGIFVVVVCLRTGRVRPELAGSLAMLVGNWFLTTYSRADLGEPAASRYVYVSAVFVVLVVADTARDVRRSTAFQGVVLVAAALCVIGNVGPMRDGAAGLRDLSQITSAELAAIEWARSIVPADFRPDEGRMPQVVAGSYLDAVDDYGSPALSQEEALAARESVRSIIDETSVNALVPRLAAVDIGQRTRPPDMIVKSGTAMSAGGCTAVVAGATPAAAEVLLPAQGIVLHAAEGTSIRLRRVADTFRPAADLVVPDAAAVTLTIPQDRLARPWHALLEIPASATVCNVQ